MVYQIGQVPLYYSLELCRSKHDMTAARQQWIRKDEQEFIKSKCGHSKLLDTIMSWKQ
jgi:hypothetical protein